MDPITAAITAALTPTLTDMTKSGIKDAYEGLKAVIRRKWGESAAISKAIAAVEDDPDSKAQATVLEEKVAAIKAADDPDVAQALHKLVQQMKANGIGGQAVASVQFKMSGGVLQGVAGAQDVTIGSMSFAAPPKG
jgi:hypothetical protein